MCVWLFSDGSKNSLAVQRGPVIVFGAVIGREGSVSGKFSGGTLANLVREVFSNCLPFFLAWSPQPVCQSLSLHSRIGRKRRSDCSSVLGKMCLWQSKQRWKALQEVLELVLDLENKKEHVFCCRTYTSDLNRKRAAIIKSCIPLFFQSTLIIDKSPLSTQNTFLCKIYVVLICLHCA